MLPEAIYNAHCIINLRNAVTGSLLRQLLYGEVKGFRMWCEGLPVVAVLYYTWVLCECYQYRMHLNHLDQ